MAKTPEVPKKKPDAKEAMPGGKNAMLMRLQEGLHDKDAAYMEKWFTQTEAAIDGAAGEHPALRNNLLKLTTDAMGKALAIGRTASADPFALEQRDNLKNDAYIMLDKILTPFDPEWTGTEWGTKLSEFLTETIDQGFMKGQSLTQHVKTGTLESSIKTKIGDPDFGDKPVALSGRETEEQTSAKNPTKTDQSPPKANVPQDVIEDDFGDSLIDEM